MGFGDAVASATRYANNPQPYYLHHFHTLCNILKSIYNKGGSVAEWLACWIQAQKARVQIAVARFITHITCRLTAKNQDQLRNPTLGNRVWATFTFSYITNSTTADLWQQMLFLETRDSRGMTQREHCMRTVASRCEAHSGPATVTHTHTLSIHRIIQMMQGSECDIQIWWIEVENVTRGRSRTNNRASSVLLYNQPLA